MQLVAIAKIGRTHGLKGWLNVQTYAQAASEIVKLGPWWQLDPVSKEPSQLIPASWLLQTENTNKMRVKFQQIDSVEQAQTLVGREIMLETKLLPALTKGEYYTYQLIGLEVFGLDGLIGKVSALYDNGAQDLLVVTRDGSDTRKPILIPYVPQIITNVDLLAQRIDALWASDF